MKIATLCYLLNNGRILLAHKKKGFGEGKLNGVGGKIMPGESPEEAAVREVKEEIGVVADRKDLQKVAELTFDHSPNNDRDHFVHVFLLRNWTGEPVESEEMAPQWYNIDALPYGQMWVSDPLWLPSALAGQFVRLEVLFNREGTEVLQYHYLQS